MTWKRYVLKTYGVYNLDMKRADLRRTTILLSGDDQAAIEVIKKRWGVSSDSDAIRLGLRILAEAKEVRVHPLPKPTSSGQESNK